jgi:integrase
MPSHKSTKKGSAAPAVLPTDPESLVRFADTLQLRSLAPTTRIEYVRYVRKLGQRAGVDPVGLDEAHVREHLLHLKIDHDYSPSSMRTACAALSAFYGLHLGHDWKLFDLVRSPDVQTLPQVLTRAEVARLFSVIREPRFLAILRLIYACGLRISEATHLAVTDIKRDGPRLHLRSTKGSKERLVPLPQWAYEELKVWWKTHRNAQWVFPGLGSGWRDGSATVEKLARAVEPMGVGSLQRCMRLAVAAAQLPKGTCVHTLRHSYATHLLDAGVNIRLISAYLGHASLETTLIYAHLTLANEGGARAVLDQLRPPTPPTV